MIPETKAVYSVRDLAIVYSVGKSYPTNTFRTTRNGYRVEIYEQKEAYKIQDGTEMWPEDWRRSIREAIVIENKTALLEKIVEHVGKHCAWLRREQEIEDYAMECLASEAYAHWADFKY